MKGVLCRQCKKVHWNGEPCPHREAARESLGVLVLDDGRFAFAGKRYPGLNNNQPMESKKAFEKELADKGLVHSSPREMREGPRKTNEHHLVEQIQETYGVSAPEARQAAQDALAGRV